MDSTFLYSIIPNLKIYIMCIIRKIEKYTKILMALFFFNNEHMDDLVVCLYFPYKFYIADSNLELFLSYLYL